MRLLKVVTLELLIFKVSSYKQGVRTQEFWVQNIPSLTLEPCLPAPRHFGLYGSLPGTRNGGFRIARVHK